MAKYVCDFDQIETLANKLISSSEDLTNSTKKYVDQIQTELSNWTGPSKEFFIKQTLIQAKYSLIKAHSYKSLGEYLKGYVNKIENLEQSLSDNKI